MQHIKELIERLDFELVLRESLTNFNLVNVKKVEDLLRKIEDEYFQEIDSNDKALKYIEELKAAVVVAHIIKLADFS